MLPFELKIPEQIYPSLVLAGIEIPAYGSTTPNETIAYNEIANSASDPKLFYFDVICLFLRTRCNYDLEFAKSALGDIPMHHLEAAFEWVKQEFQNWKEFDFNAEKKTQSQTGEQSSGDSNSDTPTAIASTPETSETAPST